jgi:uncharacterized protein (DUF4415 family)
MAKTKQTSKRSARERPYDFSGGKRGAVLSHQGKTRITMWVDTDVLDWFRNHAEHKGRGYQTAMNEALSSYAKEDHRSLPDILRDVVRDELHAALKAS